MKSVWIGCGQITWPKEWDERTILAEIAAAGYDGAPAAPRPGYGVEETLALYAELGLRPAPGYLGAEFWRTDQSDAILARAESMASFAAGVGCTELVVAAQGFHSYTTARGFTRSQVAGHVHPDDAMSAAEYRQFATTLNHVGEITLAHGVAACFHNHVGSVIETRDEIDRLWNLIDPALVFMGPDTGHLAWGGVDVVQFFRDYIHCIRTLHIKDIAPQVLAEGREKRWDYATFSANGIFIELGQGFVDFPALFRILDAAGYAGWLTVETDVTRQPSALVSAQISRAYLAGLGF
jgi:inosose dehydratase